ncbi:MAG: cupin [Acidimicrobiaceae bacterium]|nr:cupin domain-containing protein [Acidimicrobiaceae bacterium]MCY3644607.1 cupin domain-containing protein [Acidimicrobiaceae bacterium]MDE0666378.1 cupin domain-containing protein [Acidimicrobiaceae bacterium]MXY10107.1 cupin [Acidimicrobiaceae bacterium]MXZ64304.1 cupin [Acidimicrobiaceae bacterium]
MAEKPELEFHIPDGAWRPAGGPVEGIDEMILSTDGQPDGPYTRLMRFAPGVDSSPNGVLTHHFWEEVYIVEGDLTDLRLGETFTAGMYACRPPGMPHGPWRSTAGVLMVEFRTGGYNP